MYDCKICGKTYSWPDGVKRHMKVKHGRPFPIKRTWSEREDDESEQESEEESEVESEVEEEDNERIWEDLLNAIYDEHAEQYSDIVEEYMVEGMEEKEAKANACRDMLDVHVPALKEHFISIMVKAHVLRKSVVYTQIKEDACFFRKTMRAGDAFEKAVRKNPFFRQLLEKDGREEETKEQEEEDETKEEEEEEDEPVWREKLNDFAEIELCNE